MPQPAAEPDVRLTTATGGGRCLVLSGAWNLRGLESRLAELAPRLAEYAADKNSRWDLQGVDVIDHAGAMLLWRAWGRQRVANLALKPEHEPIFKHLDIPAEPVPQAARRGPLWIIASVGRKVLRVLDHLATMIMVLGQVVLDTVYLVRQPARIPWREISSNIYRTGTQALGITALVGFLVGVVLSYLSAQQLKLFGADAFIINILGISVVRELGPVLAAILIAGRSGSAITAQLGVMRVTQELDAMAVMGIPQTLRLILPKMLALAVSMPLIVLWTNAIALMGGMVSAQAELGIGYSLFSVEPARRGADRQPVAGARQGRGVRLSDRAGRVSLRPAHRAQYREPRHRHHQFGGDFDHGRDYRRRSVRDHVQGHRDQLMADCIIEVKGLWTQFGDHVVHRDIDLCVRRGEIMSLVGGSGSGKTTMLRQMLGLEEAGARRGARIRRFIARQRCGRTAQAARPLGHAVPGGRAVQRAHGV